MTAANPDPCPACGEPLRQSKQARRRGVTDICDNVACLYRAPSWLSARLRAGDALAGSAAEMLANADYHDEEEAKRCDASGGVMGGRYIGALPRAELRRDIAAYRAAKTEESE